MLNLAAAKIWLCLEPTDMRKSFDTLAARVREHLGADPMSGAWFVFRGRRGDRIDRDCTHAARRASIASNSIEAMLMPYCASSSRMHVGLVTLTSVR